MPSSWPPAPTAPPRSPSSSAAASARATPSCFSARSPTARPSRPWRSPRRAAPASSSTSRRPAHPRGDAPGARRARRQRARGARGGQRSRHRRDRSRGGRARDRCPLRLRHHRHARRGGCRRLDGRRAPRASRSHVTPVDTTAAGDAFTGAFAAALDQGLGFTMALARGAAAGSLACTKPAPSRASRPRRRSTRRPSISWRKRRILIEFLAIFSGWSGRIREKRIPTMRLDAVLGLCLVPFLGIAVMGPRLASDWANRPSEANVAAVAPAEPLPQSGVARIRNRGDGHFEVEARIGARRIPFMVDTGATLVALSWETGRGSRPRQPERSDDRGRSPRPMAR